MQRPLQPLRSIDARADGATDREIHDAVLIAAFCMYNRYVHGLATWTPVDHDLYDEMGRRLAHEGYTAGRAAAAGAGSQGA